MPRHLSDLSRPQPGQDRTHPYRGVRVPGLSRYHGLKLAGRRRDRGWGCASLESGRKYRPDRPDLSARGLVVEWGCASSVRKHQLKQQQRLAAPLRRKCEQCKTLFRANRADAEFCSAVCRQAAYRDRKSKTEIYNSFKTNLQIAQNTHDYASRYECFRGQAVTLRRRFEFFGVKDVKFVATPLGIIAVGDFIGAVNGIDYDDWRDWDGDNNPSFPLYATEYDADDPMIIEALSQRTLFAGSYLRMEHEQGDTAAIQTPVQKVLLLTLYEETNLGRRAAWGSPSAAGESYGWQRYILDFID
jgi:hypothetical protein